LGIIGDPVAHSLSPPMQNQAIAALGLDYVYVPFPVRGENLAAAIAGFAAIGVVGFNVTIPHKQAVMPLLDHCTDVAQAVGAVNTVWREGDRWQGTNTDVAGFLAPLLAQTRDWTGATAVILGSGGVARAIVAGCRQLGCGRMVVLGRSPAKLAALAAQFQPPNPWAQAIEPHPWETLAEHLPTADLVVNATPLGMAPHIEATPIALADWARVPAHAVVYDTIYTPSPTRYLRDAAAHGLTILDGTAMLVGQGAAALTQWVGQPAPIAVMEQALLRALGR
jgi:shikimate dehydrogenase